MPQAEMHPLDKVRCAMRVGKWAAMWICPDGWRRVAIFFTKAEAASFLAGKLRPVSVVDLSKESVS